MKVKAYFLKAPMNVSGVAQERMVGSFIIKKLYPLYLFFSQGLSGVAQREIGGSIIRKKLFSFTTMGKLGGTRGLSGFSWTA